MPRYLMDLCFIYQEGDCPIDDIKNARRVGKIEEDKMKLFPSGEDQERLDQICEKCERRMFKIETPECPVCHGGIGPAIISKWKAASRTIYQYRCIQCNSLLYSPKKIV